MTAETLLKLAAVIQAQDHGLMAAKNHDYAGDADCLENLRGFGFHGVVVRLSDKFTRLKNFAIRRAAGETDLLRVKDESIKETLRDIRIYGLLAEVMLDEESEKQEEQCQS